MPFDPDKYKQDPRTPQELAKAILDHQVTPQGGGCPYSVSFRERLLMDYQAMHDDLILRKYGEPLVIVLKGMEEGASPDRDDKRYFRHGLRVIDSYKKEAAEWRDDEARKARETNGPHAQTLRRAAAESMETRMVEINNFKAIEKLIRTLAVRIGVSLVETEREK